MIGSPTLEVENTGALAIPWGVDHPFPIYMSKIFGPEHLTTFKAEVVDGVVARATILSLSLNTKLFSTKRA